MSWATRRREPYTEAKIGTIKCIRCPRRAKFQWTICADGNNYRPVCGPCDVELNAIVLAFMKHPDVEGLVRAYEKKKLSQDPMTARLRASFLSSLFRRLLK